MLSLRGEGVLLDWLEQKMIRKLFIEYIEQNYQKSYTEVCLGEFDILDNYLKTNW